MKEHYQVAREVDDVELKSFEQLYADVFEIEYNGSTVEYVDLRPEKHPAGNLPIVLVGGWASTLESLRNFSKELYLRNQHVIVLDYTKSAAARETEFEPKINREIARKAEGLIEVVGRIGLERADVIAISEGALVATSAAEFIPGCFRNLALLTPAGLIGRDGPWRPGGLAWRYFVLNTLENLRARKNPATEDSPTYDFDMSHVNKDLRKYYKEGKAISQSCINDSLKDLRHQGLGIGILQAHRDVIFPNRRMKKQIKIQGSEANADSWSVIATETAGHQHALIYPDKVALAALQILDNLTVNTPANCRDGSTAWRAESCRQGISW